MLFAAALFAMAVGPHRVGDYFAETDFYGGYAEGARNLMGGFLNPTRYGVVGPVHEVTLALVGLGVPDLLFGAELISLVAMVAGLLLWYHLLARRADPRLALIATLFMTVNPTFFRYGFSATNDALAFGLQAAALFVLLTRSGQRAAAAAGALAALAFLTRYNAIYLLPAGLVALLAGGTLHPQRARAALAFAGGFLGPVLPWTLFSLAHGGAFASQLHHNIAYDVFARSHGIAWDDYQRTLQPGFRTLWDVIARDPGAVARRELFNVWDHLRLDGAKLLGLPMTACAALGAVLAWRDGTLARAWPIGVAGALLFLTLVPAFHAERYSLPLLPAYLALAAAAFASPRFAVVVGRGSRVWLKPVFALLPLVLAGLWTFKATARVLDQLPVEVLDCGRTLRELGRPGDRVIARKPHIGFHGRAQALAFPFTTTLPELAAYARTHRARWLFFSWPEAELRPAYWYLLDTAAVVPGLTVRRSTPDRPAVLYEIGPEFGTVPAWFENDTTRAWHMARARLRVNPADVNSMLTLALIDFDRGRFAASRARLERLVARAPGKLQAWLLLGEVSLHLEDGPRAATAYERAEAIDPRNVEARVGRGWASLVSRRPREAASLWRPVVSSARDPATLERMIDLYRAVGDPAAEAEARAALARLRGRS